MRVRVTCHMHTLCARVCTYAHACAQCAHVHVHVACTRGMHVHVQATCTRAHLERATALLAAEGGSDCLEVKSSTFCLVSRRAYVDHQSLVDADCFIRVPSRSALKPALGVAGMSERSSVRRSDRSFCFTSSCSCAFLRRISMTLLQYVLYLLATTPASPSSWLTEMVTKRS